MSLKVSYIGNGVNDVVTTNLSAVLSTTYQAAGICPATLTLVDANGGQYVVQVQVVVQDPAQMDAMFSGIWRDLWI